MMYTSSTEFRVEATFTTNGLVLFQNLSYWSADNPNQVVNTKWRKFPLNKYVAWHNPG